MLKRKASTLVEMLVALTLAAIILAAATSSVLRQQHTHERIAIVSGSDMQIRGGSAVLANQLSYIDAAAGDLSAGALRDTAIQFRATVAVALACQRSAGVVTLLPDQDGAVPFSGYASLPRAGDSLWFLGDSVWRGARVTAVAEVVASCPAPFAVVGPALELTLNGSSDTIPAASPMRVTRQSRYSFYRSGDGTWQLGFREWSNASNSFSGPQPVAGPFLRQSDGRKSRFRFFDTVGTELSPDDEIDRRVARVRLITYSRAFTRERGQDSVRSDSLDVALQSARAR